MYYFYGIEVPKVYLLFDTEEIQLIGIMFVYHISILNFSLDNFQWKTKPLKNLSDV